MRYRPLGASGIEVSAIGFGAWGIGGRTRGATSYGETDDAVSRRALDEAFDRGITFYDTASVYGDGRSEELIGESFGNRRDKVVIATKAGITAAFGGYDFSATALQASLEGSLRRLRTDYVDLFQLHNAGAEVVLGQPDIVGLLQRLVREGKVRAFGFSTPSPHDALALLEVPQAACFQVNCNLLDWRAMDLGLLDRAKAQGIGIIARTPLAFGFLTGRFDRTIEFPPEDHRSRWSRSRIAAWLDAAEEIALHLRTETVESRVTAALQFCLSFATVVTVIPGMLTPAEVVANAAAGDAKPFDAAELGGIERIYQRHMSLLES